MTLIIAWNSKYRARNCNQF